jgi:hypothetical protein
LTGGCRPRVCKGKAAVGLGFVKERQQRAWGLSKTGGGGPRVCRRKSALSPRFGKTLSKPYRAALMKVQTSSTAAAGLGFVKTDIKILGSSLVDGADMMVIRQLLAF